MVSRLLLKFNTESDELYTTQPNSQYFLSLRITESRELMGKTTLNVHPVKTDWEEGYGRFHDKTIGSGATWISNGNETDWSLPGADFYEKHELMALCGLDLSSYEFNRRTSDILIDITDYVTAWKMGELKNNGLLVKFANETIKNTGSVMFFSKDTNTIYYPHIKVSTNDFLFNPCGCKQVERVRCVYNDKVDNLAKPKYHKNCISGSLASGSLASGSLASGSLASGSLASGSLVSGSLVSGSLVSGSVHQTDYTLSNIDPAHIHTDDLDCGGVLAYDIQKIKPDINYITGENLFMSIHGLSSQISVKEQHRIRVVVREKYPVKTFTKKSKYSKTNFVDHPLYYSVIDADTLERVINYDQYSRISCDADGHYFDFDYGVLAVGRLYQFEIRVESPNQTKIILDKIKFKVSR
jgi:hypothetical protein